MSVRSSIYYEGKWHAFHTADRHGERGVFVDGDSFGSPKADDDGYSDFEVNNHTTEASFSVHLPWAVCEAIAKHVADVNAHWTPFRP